MATEVKSANVTKYNAGGSGDNVVNDGLIKSVEKIWTDTYVIGSAGDVTTMLSISIAKVPAWKKITDVLVSMPISSGIAATSVSLSLHLASSATDSPGTTGNLGLMVCIAGNGAPATADAATASTHRLNPTGFLASCGSTALDLWVQFDMEGGRSPNTTGGTLKTLVRYV